MIEIIAGIIVYRLLRDEKDEGATSLPEDDKAPAGGVPTPPMREYVKIAEWSGETVYGENVVWMYRTGIRYTDGETKLDNTTYIVIGDAAHHNFYRQSTSGGTINIPKELSGGDKDMKNVVVFPTLEAAQAKAEELSNPPEEDDPMGPQKQPEKDDDKPSLPPLPTRPPMGGGFGGYTPFGGM